MNPTFGVQQVLASHPAPPGRSGWPWTIAPETDLNPSGIEWPKITIVTPSFNQGAFIEETIRSVLLQGYPNLEYIIVDGGSSDESPAIIERYSAELTHWESIPDRGQSEALNKGFARGSGEIMAWLCADDFYLPGALFRVARAFLEQPDLDILCGNGRFIDTAGRPTGFDYAEPLNISNLHNWCSICSPATFWRRELWERAGAYVDQKNHCSMDWELMLRMCRLATPQKIEDFLAGVRRHTGSKSITGVTGDDAFRRKRDREVVTVSRKYGGPFCFNSVAYELEKLIPLARPFARGPRLLYSAIFRIVHWPLKFVHFLYGRPKSNLMTD